VQVQKKLAKVKNKRKKNLNFNKSIIETSLPRAVGLFDTSVERVGTYE